MYISATEQKPRGRASEGKKVLPTKMSPCYYRASHGSLIPTPIPGPDSSYDAEHASLARVDTQPGEGTQSSACTLPFA